VLYVFVICISISYLCSYIIVVSFFFFFFFFQAEDGIRDKLVTGVQTCALPISFRGMAGHPADGLPAAGIRRENSSPPGCPDHPVKSFSIPARRHLSCAR